jgi:hypothetical protein
MGLLRMIIDGGLFKGTPAHTDFQLEAQQLALWAQMNFTPEQLHRANLLADQSKLEWIEHARQEQMAYQDAEALAVTEKTTRAMTHGMLGQSHGISAAQLRAIRDGADIPREARPRFSQAAMDADWRRFTKHLDPRGKGWNEKEGIRRLDALVDAAPERFAHEARNFKGGEALLRKEAAQWDKDRIGYGLLRKRIDRDIQLGRRPPDTQEPSPRDRRRAAVVDAYFKTTADAIEKDSYAGKESEAYRDVTEQVPSHLLEEEHDGKPTRRAQIAQIVAQADADGEWE